MLAIVPVNAPERAKGRLASLLPLETRTELVQAMLDDVVRACWEASAVEGVLVVSPDPSLAPAGCETLRDPGTGHAAAISAALALPAAQAGALVIMADCPLVPPATLDALAAAANPIALVPAQDGGTNALALRPADVIEPAFGEPGGAAILAARADELGLDVRVLDEPLIALDVDDEADVRRLLELGEGTATHAVLSRALAALAR